jgi:hypothetical protein
MAMKDEANDMPIAEATSILDHTTRRLSAKMTIAQLCFNERHTKTSRTRPSSKMRDQV